LANVVSMFNDLRWEAVKIIDTDTPSLILTLYHVKYATLYAESGQFLSGLAYWNKENYQAKATCWWIHKSSTLYSDLKKKTHPSSCFVVMKIHQHSRQFLWKSSIPFKFNIFLFFFIAASREAAFMHSILAAGVVSAIARSCRDGELRSCSCSKKNKNILNLNG
jgi:hypothetical protein